MGVLGGGAHPTMNDDGNGDGAQRLFPRCGWILCSSAHFLYFAVFLHLPCRSGKLQPVMIELRRCSDGGWYPLDPVDNGAEEGEENQRFRGGSMVSTQKMFGRDVFR